MRSLAVEPTTIRLDSPDSFEESMATVAGPVSVRPEKDSPFHAKAELARLPRLGLFTLETSEFRVLTTEPLGFLSVTIPLARHFLAADSNDREPFRPGSAHIASIDRPFDLHTSNGLQVLVANFDRSLLNAYRTKFNGGEALAEREFCPRMSLMSQDGASFWRYLSFVWGEVGHGSALLSSPLVAREIEDSLMAMFLYASESNLPERNHSPVADISRTYLNRAEEFMLAHLSDPVSIADIAEAVGVNGRTLSRAFKKRYGLGPIAFLKQRRLESAQRALLGADPQCTYVTAVATRFGFYHLGQFSIDYRKAFQELPSETLRR